MAQAMDLYLVQAKKTVGDAAWRRTHESLKTKKSGAEAMQAWRDSHEANGWIVEKHGDYLVAFKDGEERSIGVHEYDSETKDRIYVGGGWRFRRLFGTGEMVVEKRPAEKKPKTATERPRRGRGKPAYV